jgi:hypothetical protein
MVRNVNWAMPHEAFDAATARHLSPGALGRPAGSWILGVTCRSRHAIWTRRIAVSRARLAALRGGPIRPAAPGPL